MTTFDPYDNDTIDAPPTIGDRIDDLLAVLTRNETDKVSDLLALFDKDEAIASELVNVLTLEGVLMSGVRPGLFRLTSKGRKLLHQDGDDTVYAMLLEYAREYLDET